MNPYIIILAVVTVGGIAITIWGWQALKASQKRRDWPNVEGVIEESAPSSTHDDLLPHIVYRYEISGENLRRTFEFPSGTNPLPEFADTYVKKYPVGAKVRVYYNPHQPQESTLEPGARGDWMILVLGILMVAGGVGALFASI